MSFGPLQSLLVDQPEIDEILDLETGEVAPARSYVGADFEEVLRFRMGLMEAMSSKAARYACPLCVVPVHLVCMKQERKFYFRHETEDGRCPAKTKGSMSGERILAMKYDGARESVAHVRMKEIIASSLRCDPEFSDVRVEPVWKGAEANSRRKPDVTAIWRGKLRVAFEVQLSTTFLRVVAERRMFYLKEGGLLVWVFKNFSMGDSKLMQDDIYYNNNRNAFVASDETLAASREQGRMVLDCVWSTPSLVQGELLWEQQRGLAPFSSLTIEQSKHWVYLFDAEGAKSELLTDPGDAILRKDFEHYWMAVRPGNPGYDMALWSSLVERFEERGLSLPPYPGGNYALTTFLDTLYSAREGRAVGWRHSSLLKVAHHVFDKYKSQLWGFKVMLAAHDRGEQIKAEDGTRNWRDKKVPAYRKGWAEGDPAFAPDRQFDDLFAFLFPEIAEGLSAAPG